MASAADILLRGDRPAVDLAGWLRRNPVSAAGAVCFAALFAGFCVFGVPSGAGGTRRLPRQPKRAEARRRTTGFRFAAKARRRMHAIRLGRAFPSLRGRDRAQEPRAARVSTDNLDSRSSTRRVACSRQTKGSSRRAALRRRRHHRALFRPPVDPKPAASRPSQPFPCRPCPQEPRQPTRRLAHSEPATAAAPRRSPQRRPKCTARSEAQADSATPARDDDASGAARSRRWCLRIDGSGSRRIVVRQDRARL